MGAAELMATAVWDRPNQKLRPSLLAWLRELAYRDSRRYRVGDLL